MFSKKVLFKRDIARLKWLYMRQIFNNQFQSLVIIFKLFQIVAFDDQLHILSLQEKPASGCLRPRDDNSSKSSSESINSCDRQGAHVFDELTTTKTCHGTWPLGIYGYLMCRWSSTTLAFTCHKPRKPPYESIWAMSCLVDPYNFGFEPKVNIIPSFLLCKNQITKPGGRASGLANCAGVTAGIFLSDSGVPLERPENWGRFRRLRRHRVCYSWNPIKLLAVQIWDVHFKLKTAVKGDCAVLCFSKVHLEPAKGGEKPFQTPGQDVVNYVLYMDLRQTPLIKTKITTKTSLKPYKNDDHHGFYMGFIGVSWSYWVCYCGFCMAKQITLTASPLPSRPRNSGPTPRASPRGRPWPPTAWANPSGADGFLWENGEGDVQKSGLKICNHDCSWFHHFIMFLVLRFLFHLFWTHWWFTWMGTGLEGTTSQTVVNAEDLPLDM